MEANPRPHWATPLTLKAVASPMSLFVSGNQWRRYDSKMEPQREKNLTVSCDDTKQDS
jgi:hypothetical protein